MRFSYIHRARTQLRINKKIMGRNGKPRGVICPLYSLALVIFLSTFHLATAAPNSPPITNLSLPAIVSPPVMKTIETQSEILLKQLANSPELYLKIINRDGRFWLNINGREIYPWMLALSSDPFSESAQTFIRSYHDAGINIIEMIVNSRQYVRGSYSETPPGDPDHDAYDFENDAPPTETSYPGLFNIKKRFLAIISANPDALILVRVDVSSVPKWWRTEYQSEFSKFNDGSSFIGPAHGIPSYATQPSMSSRRWEQFAVGALEALVQYIETTPFKRRVVGYCINYGESSERLWNGWGHTKNGSPLYLDYSEPTVRMFRDYLRTLYAGKVEELKNAWGDPSVTFENATVPTAQERASHGLGDFKTGGNHDRALDFYHYLDSRNEDLIEKFADIVHQGSAGKKIIGTPGTYGLAHTTAQFQQGGHIAGTPRLLRHPHIDFIGAPNSMFDRGIGGVTYSVGMLESYGMHQKLAIAEEDLRTPYQVRKMQMLMEDITNWEGCIETLTRDVLYQVMKGHGIWWLDLGGDGAYNYEPLIQKAKQINQMIYQTKNAIKKTYLDVALIVDPEIVYHVSSESKLTRCSEVFQMTEICRMGAPFDSYYISDFEQGLHHSYKMYIFMGAVKLSEAAKRQILDMKSRKATALWLYGTGMYDQAQISSFEISKMTGIDLRIKDETRNLSGTLLANSWKDVISNETFGGGQRPLTWLEKKRLEKPYPNPECGPLIYSVDRNARVLANYVNSELPCLSQKTIRGFTSVVSGADNLSSKILRNIARDAGVHIFSENDDFVMVAGNALLVSFYKEGPNFVTVPEHRFQSATDALSGSHFSADSNRIYFNVKYGHRNVLLLDEVSK